MSNGIDDAQYMHEASISTECPTIIKDWIGRHIGSASGYDDSGYFPSDEEAIENAKRIVVLWNLAQGIPTPRIVELESILRALMQGAPIVTQHDG